MGRTPPSAVHEEGAEAGLDAADAEQKKKRRRRRRRRKGVASEEEEETALRFVRRWACPGAEGIEEEGHEGEEGEVGRGRRRRRRRRVVVELHSHSARSDGSLSPAALVERAHRNGVKILALTDHDTMAGVPEAMEAAKKYSIRIIPGVEISAVYSPRDGSGTEEPVHILAYYGGWGPAKFQELEMFLDSIRHGRYARAKEMLFKLRGLDMPIEFEDVCKIAGNGVAPGRLHVARAMVQAGYVENLRQAFSRYLYDRGPAYATGSEPTGESVVQLVHRTGGIAALAHPWALKNQVAVVKTLKAAGLHAIEVYRSDGKLSGLSDLADTHGLLKLGGSDYHGKNDVEEPDVGSVEFPVLEFSKFLKLALPIWGNAFEEILTNFTGRAPDLNDSKGFSWISTGKDFVHPCLSSRNLEKMETSEVEVLETKLFYIGLTDKALQAAL